MTDYITRKEAISQDKKKFFVGKTCKNGHVAERYVGSYKCVQCASEETKKYTKSGYFNQYYTKNKEHLKQLSKQWAQNNRQTVSDISNQWNKRNKERMEQYWKEYYSDPVNRERHNQKSREYRNNHKGKYAAHTRNRQAKQLQATPCWLTTTDRHRIEQLYQQAIDLTKETGIKHVVDHYYPLRGKNVSGLHCPDNLRIITEHENATKSNKMPLD